MMVNRSRIKGTSWESAIVQFLQAHGWPHVERRALSGNTDKGDIAGIPGVMVEAKSAKTISLAAWADETTVEKTNAHADIGVTWVKRRGRTSPGAGYVVMDGDQFVQILRDLGYGP